MIKIERVSITNLENAIRGMRNPMKSWAKSDSFMDQYGNYIIGEADMKLAMTLAKSGSDDRKFMRQIFVSMDINAPLYWWKEYDTYKVGTVANSTSTMHTIMKKPFEIEDFSVERMYPEERTWFEKVLMKELETIRGYYMEYDRLAELGVFGEGITKKVIWDTLIQLLPTSYNQLRTCTLNYENLANMYKARRNHKLDEWRDFCGRIEMLPYSELITG